MFDIKDIHGYDGKYQVTSDGRVLSRHYGGRELKADNRRGYLSVVLSKDGQVTRVSIHRLVAQHFIPNPENKPQVNHKDLNKHNNTVGNLEWVTVSENTKHAQLAGTMDGAYAKAKEANAKRRFEDNTSKMKLLLGGRYLGLSYDGYRTRVQFQCAYCNEETECRTDDRRLKHEGRCNAYQCKLKEKIKYGD